MSVSRSAPAAWIVRAKSICFSERLPSWLSESIFDRISSEFSGVRSSCDMFARNSDLYFEDSASWVAFSSSASLACSTSRFLRSTSMFCSDSSRAFSAISILVCCSSCASDCDWLSSLSVRLLVSMVCSTTPIDSIN